MPKTDLTKLSATIKTAIAAGQAAADAQPDDGGSANLDRVVLYANGVREATMHKAGIDGYKGRHGWFHLSAPFNGQGNRRYAGVQAMHAFLVREGVPCFVYYQVD